MEKEIENEGGKRGIQWVHVMCRGIQAREWIRELRASGFWIQALLCEL